MQNSVWHMHVDDAISFITLTNTLAIYWPKLRTFATAGHPHPSGTLILGGTGAIGSLTGSWLMEEPHANVHLIGRSGRVGTLAVGNAAGSLSICRCDATSKEEASALIHHLRQRGPSLPGTLSL